MRKQVTDFATKKLKETIMGNGQNDRSSHADTIIRNHVILSMGAGFMIPIPIADVLAVSALQLDMIRQLSRVYEIDFAESQGKAIISSLTSSTLARAGARSFIKLVPGIGTFIGGATVSAFNGASTYAVGEVFKRHFESGGTILDFDTERLKNLYKEKFEKGKKVVQDWKQPEEQPETTTTTGAAPAERPAATPSAPTNDKTIMDKIKELAAMRDAGLLSEEEFTAMKGKLIQEM